MKEVERERSISKYILQKPLFAINISWCIEHAHGVHPGFRMHLNKVSGTEIIKTDFVWAKSLTNRVRERNVWEWTTEKYRIREREKRTEKEKEKEKLRFRVVNCTTCNHPSLTTNFRKIYRASLCLCASTLSLSLSLSIAFTNWISRNRYGDSPKGVFGTFISFVLPHLASVSTHQQMWNSKLNARLTKALYRSVLMFTSLKWVKHLLTKCYCKSIHWNCLWYHLHNERS